jgi:hypothetical protein
VTRRIPHDESKRWAKEQFPWQDVEEYPEQLRDRLNMALLFLSRIDSHVARQATALERIADALGAARPAPEERAAGGSQDGGGTEQFFVEPRRRNPPRRPRKKGSGQWKPGPCPTHGKLLDEEMMCVDCRKELEEWTTEQTLNLSTS